MCMAALTRPHPCPFSAGTQGAGDFVLGLQDPLQPEVLCLYTPGMLCALALYTAAAAAARTGCLQQFSLLPALMSCGLKN